MIQTVKIDKRNNYFLDTLTGNILDRYDPENENLQLVISLPDSTLTVDSSRITKEFGGQIIVQHNNDRYIIDDGFQNILIKAGYLVFKDYDERNEYDQDVGLKIRDSIINQTRDIVPEFAKSYNKCDYADVDQYISYNGNSTELIIEGDDYSYTVIFDTINNIVNKNQRRRDNSLTFYPFDKSMDRYGTIYISIFAQKNRVVKNNTPYKKYIIPNAFIREITKALGAEYHFLSLPIKEGQVLYWKGM